MPEESVSEAQYHGVLENPAVDELPPPIDRDTKIVSCVASSVLLSRVVRVVDDSSLPGSVRKNRFS